MNIHSRIRQAREKAGHTQASLARALNVSTPAVQNWEKEDGTAPKRDRINEVARVLNVSPDWLLTGNDANLELNGRYYFVPLYKSKYQTREGQVAQHVSVANYADDTDTYAFRIDWIERKGLRAAALTIVLAPEDAMAPVFSTGDVLVVNTDDTTIVDKQVYAFDSPAGVVVRRCFVRLDGMIVLRADNPTYPEQTFARDTLDVVGRVITASIAV